MIAVNEKSPLFMTMTFEDETGAPLTPTTVEWRLDDKTNGVEVVPWTSLPSPSSTMNVTVPGADNAIADEAHVQELQIFGIRVDNGQPGEGHAELAYNVLNLSGPTGV